MRQVQQIMGMPITIDIPGCQKESFFDEIFAHLRDIDRRFSTFKPESEVSKFRKGEISTKDLSGQIKAVMNACKKAETETEGYFSAFYDGKFDPSGYVKGWAMAEAGQLIARKYKTYCLSAGGDILAGSAGEKVWQIGIQDPKDKQEILNMLSISNGAAATSGTYERGPHIINPKARKPAGEFLSVTVTGPSIIKADVFATAIFAKGNTAFRSELAGYEAIIVDKQSRLSYHSLGNSR